ncbi:N-acetylmuramoyl-L-alanine amidase [Auritidibacter sp. NML100628]|uniref:peptidoglycan recognition protein family protein n=1 Tax=Auritidibacter sp. NML100628 TaxID=2170742 RepID=UPI000D726A34|nr:N-acetylmuramoyl-L-alanine amidase [Auritidibacter sp. NML100628]PXA76877.1 hypothetical protein DCC24_06160 [Auritidibacter sp. NML100628]
MAIYEEAEYRNIFEVRTEVTPTDMSPVRVNLHVTASENPSAWGFQIPEGGPLIHFHVAKDGTVEQYVDTQYRAGSDLEGNPDTISIESQGGVEAPNEEPWTEQQVTSITALLDWILANHDSIPLKLAEDSIPGESSHGISWHRLGIPHADGIGVEGWLQEGGLRYSEDVGKVCPGTVKIEQIPGIYESLNSGGVPDPDPAGVQKASSKPMPRTFTRQDIVPLYDDACPSLL